MALMSMEMINAETALPQMNSIASSHSGQGVLAAAKVLEDRLREGNMDGARVIKLALEANLAQTHLEGSSV